MCMYVKIIERDVLDPLAETESIKIELVSLPSDISQISLFDNTKPNADRILDIIQKNLDNINFYRVKKPAGAPATMDQLENAAKADLSILALGDCGSCTTWVILDAIRLEKEGTPTISICSHQFTPFARELAETHGMGNLRIVEIRHPIAGQSPEQIERKVQNILPEIKDLLKLD